MAGDILNPDTVQSPAPLPAVMVAEVLDVAGDGSVTVTVQALDGRQRAHPAFGTLPAGMVGQRVRVMLDELGGLVIVSAHHTT